MKLLRVVFDTNVVVSAALASQKHLVAQGRPSLCLQLALNGLKIPRLRVEQAKRGFAT
jgi:hypothetical protein